MSPLQEGFIVPDYRPQSHNSGCILSGDLFSAWSSNVHTVRICMNTTKAIYWIALAAFAFALNTEYQRGSFPAVHLVVADAATTLCHVATRAEQILAMARLTPRRALSQNSLLAMNTSEMAQNQADMLRDQAQSEAEMLREQAKDKADMLRDQVRNEMEMVRVRARMQQDQIEQIRFRTLSEVSISNAMNRQVVMVAPARCPNSVHVAVNAGTVSSDDEDDSF
jgi:hypothetical protein